MKFHLFVSLLHTVVCTIIYLSPTGSDSNTCLTVESPCLTWSGAENPGGGHSFVVFHLMFNVL
jgi:hypothetical protein